MEITNEYMQQMLTTIKPYCLILLKYGHNASAENAKEIIWEHGRKNFALRASGKLSIVAPIKTENADVVGLYIFNCSEDEAKEIMKEDPAVIAGIFEFTTYTCMSFPGDKLG